MSDGRPTIRHADLGYIGREILKVAAKAAMRGAARGVESVLADAQRGVKIIGGRLSRAVERARAMQVDDDDNETGR